MPEQQTWWEIEPRGESRASRVRRASDPNPLIAVDGPGPSETVCGTCRHFVRIYTYRKTFGKCQRRGVTHGAATDHYVTWPACGRYQKASDGNE